MPRLLAGLLVIDFTRVLSGPFCTMILADLGARVIKIEAPDGDEARRIGPFVAGHSVYFASVNRGKESVVLDLKRAEGREAVLRLACRADVFVENSRPGAMAALGLDYGALADRIESVTAARPRRHWLEALQAAEVPAGPINRYDEVFTDPQVLAREMVVDVEHPTLGRIRTLGSPVKLSHTPPRVDRRAPLLGEHTAAVLREAGFDEAAIARLQGRGSAPRDSAD